MKKIVFLIFMVSISMSKYLFAADRPKMPPEKDLSVFVGAVGMYSSTMNGINDYTFSIVPDLQIRYKEDFFASVPEGIGYNVITRPRGESGWKIGPLAKIKFKRDEKDKSPFVIKESEDKFRGMGNINNAIEAGAFIDYKVKKIQTRLEARQGFGGHSGVVIDAKISYNNNLGPLRFGLGPRILWTSADYNQTYYGVSPAQSAITGFNEYHPGAGLTSYGIGGFAMMPITQKTVVTMFSGYDMLIGYAKDSPVIQRYKSANQLTLGIGFSYKFGFDL